MDIFDIILMVLAVALVIILMANIGLVFYAVTHFI